MANVLDQMIAEVTKQKLGLDGEEAALEEEFLSGLQALKEVLGEDPPEEVVKEALEKFIVDFFEEDDGEEEDPVEISEEEKIALDRDSSVVEKFLKENDWSYENQGIRGDEALFELGLDVEGIKLDINVYCQVNPRACGIEAVLPILVDPTYEFPLCTLLAKKNYYMHYGSFKYDEDNGVISFELNFSTPHGINKEILAEYFQAVVESAAYDYEDIRKTCQGQFNQEETKMILDMAKDLVKEIKK
ncbi:MAG: hypothetical protein PT957_00135 [Firmicutes bacterium]|nr:hypothetical protein [Bacillota bacterium]